MASSIIAIVQNASKLLFDARVDSPYLSAQVLLAYVLNKNRDYIIINPHEFIEGKIEILFNDLISRRAKGEPVAYLVGEKEFYGRYFYVDSNVLIPRPETELLLDIVLDQFRKNPFQNFADIATGSGIIGISLNLALPEIFGVLTDISADALEVCHKNKIRHKAFNLNLLQTSFLESFTSNSLECIISNPPYISTSDMLNLSSEITNFEPRLALEGGSDGLDCYRALLTPAKKILKENGFLALEIGCSQGRNISNFLCVESWKDVKIHKDYSGLDRFITAKRSV